MRPVPLSAMIRTLLVAWAALATRASDCPHDDPTAPATATVNVPYGDEAGRRQLDTLPPLRLVFNTEVMDGDSRACTTAGDIVRIGDPTGSPSTNPCSTLVGADSLYCVGSASSSFMPPQSPQPSSSQACGMSEISLMAT